MKKIEKTRNLEAARIFLIQAHDFIDVALDKIDQISYNGPGTEVFEARKELNKILSTLKTVVVRAQLKEKQ